MKLFPTFGTKAGIHKSSTTSPSVLSSKIAVGNQYSPADIDIPTFIISELAMQKDFNFLSQLTGSFGRAAAGNATVAMIEAAYRHHEMNWRYINCEVSPEKLGDSVRGARAMGWAGFNCSLPQG